jgi:tRNA pseudouridine38-40 synthase
VRNVRVLLAYDGARFFGWQRQEGFPSVQAALEESVLSLSGERVVAHGAGRTDTGVHALGQVASFHLASRLSDERLLFALNAHAPEGLCVRALETCPDAFHAQKSARGKRYAYLVRTETFPLPFARAHWHWVPEALDLGAMRAAARHFVGRHDFAALASAGSPRRSSVRTIRALHLVARRARLAFVVEGDGFLYNMVRTLVGTLLEVGRGRRTPAEIPALLAARDRRAAGATAPPGGLYLVRVLYPEPCFARGPRGPRGRPGCFPG